MAPNELCDDAEFFPYKTHFSNYILDICGCLEKKWPNIPFIVANIFGQCMIVTDSVSSDTNDHFHSDQNLI